jgi:hypothetical protein
VLGDAVSLWGVLCAWCEFWWVLGGAEPDKGQFDSTQRAGLSFPTRSGGLSGLRCFGRVSEKEPRPGLVPGYAGSVTFANADGRVTSNPTRFSRRSLNWFLSNSTPEASTFS